jgi:SNF2 family DNA or RNA helicase
LLNAKVIPNRKALLLDGDAILPKVIPDTVVLPNGQMVVPHDVATTRILRNLKYQVPSPVHHHYDWNGTTPFLAQKATAAMLVCEPKAYVLSGMGVGKTRAVLYAYDFLRKEGRAARMLVLAPLSTLNFTWAREVWANFPGYSVGVLYGSKERRLKVLNENHDIYVINHDGPGVIGAELAAKHFDIICIDELSVFRNHRAQRSKNLAKLLVGRPYVWGLTGTPTPRDPTDAFGLIKLVQPGSPHLSSYTRFRDELMVKVSQFRWSPRPGAQERVYQLLQPAVRFTLQECVDIPPLTYSDREVELSSKQKRAYEALKNFCCANDGGGITAANEGVLLNKLLQVSAGCV